MSTVAHILKTKNGAISTIGPNKMVREALIVMAEKNIGAILVSDNEKLVGIFSERDYARKVILKDKASDNTAISEIMTAKPITVLPETKIDECLQLMTEKHIRHLPVVVDEKILGIISIGDLVKFIIEDQQNRIQNLESYISGQ
jgi:CBS domain-containing protein